MANKEESWKELFKRQVSSGKFWKSVFKDEFDKHMFLDRSDVTQIVKEAQIAAYHDVVLKIEGCVSEEVMEKIYMLIEKTVEEDNSGLGLKI